MILIDWFTRLRKICLMLLMTMKGILTIVLNGIKAGKGREGAYLKVKLPEEWLLILNSFFHDLTEFSQIY